MKKTLIVIATLVAGFALADAPYSVTVSTNSVVLAPSKPLVDTSAWASNTVYAQGAVVTSGGYYYFATVGGTSSNTAPTNTTGQATDGTVTWHETNKNRRNGVLI